MNKGQTMSKAQRIIDLCEAKDPKAKLSPKDRKAAVAGLYEISKKKWQEIPWEEIKQALSKGGLIVLQEDDTPWTGMFLGTKGDEKMRIAYADSETLRHILLDEDPDKTVFDTKFIPIENSFLILQWYKDGMTKYEINTYLS